MTDEDFPRLIQDWFSLSYSSFLVLPRTVLQSMPDDWQAKFVALLDELEATVVRHGIDLPVSRVHGKTREGGAVLKDLSDYQRGRRRLWEPGT